MSGLGVTGVNRKGALLEAGIIPCASESRWMTRGSTGSVLALVVQ
jgi:hypothetical protein